MEWTCAEPFLTATQLRALVAIKNGAKTQLEVARIIHRHNTYLSNEAFIPLQKWGLIHYSRVNREWVLVRSWQETLDEIKARIESRCRGMISALEDFLDPPPLEAPDGQR